MTGRQKILVVNEKDEVIGEKYRRDMDYDQDIFRSSVLWLTNSSGEVLLAKRVMTKKKDPGKWGPSVAGTLEVGETYDSNMVKEIQEEIGLGGVKLIAGSKIFEDVPRKHFIQWYTASVD
ncbi:MAG: NUDIX domain-containing protein, partial [Gammaproteobacteria bacterium]|nr:NUDIX domain-containing protein [Gammaproteobacteria bacterium]